MPCLLPGPEGGMAWHGLSVATWWNSESRRLAADGVHVVEQQRWQDRLCADAVCICQVATQNMYAEVRYYIIFPKMRYEYGPNDLYLSVMNPAHMYTCQNQPVIFFNRTFTSFSSTGQKVLQTCPSLTKLLPICFLRRHKSSDIHWASNWYFGIFSPNWSVLGHQYFQKIACVATHSVLCTVFFSSVWLLVSHQKMSNNANYIKESVFRALQQGTLSGMLPSYDPSLVCLTWYVGCRMPPSVLCKAMLCWALWYVRRRIWALV